MLQQPIQSCFHLYVTWQVTRPLPPEAQCSVDTWRSEDRNNPENSGNAKAEYNVILTVQFFSTKKGKGGENYRPQNMFRCCMGREERRLSKLRKLCKLHTFTIFFLLLFSFIYRSFWYQSIPAPRSCDFLDLPFFQTIIDIERKHS